MYLPIARLNAPRPRARGEDPDIGTPPPPRSPLRLAEGNVLILLHPGRDRSRILSAERRGNKVTRTGRQIVRDLLANTGPAPSALAVGTDPTPAEDSDLSLGQEVFRSLFTRRVPSESSIIYELYLTDQEANGETLSEAGLIALPQWSHSGLIPQGGFLFARVTHTPIEKDSSVSVTYVWEIPISSS